MDTIDVEPFEKARLQEVADGLLKIYRTMARMRYLDPEWIVEGPHDVSEHLDSWRADGIEDPILYLYSILPYVDTGGAAGVDFFEGGEFVDFRDGGPDFARDPNYTDEDEAKLKPWMTVLEMMGNHATFMVYSAKHHGIWIGAADACGPAGPDVSDAGDPENWVQFGVDEDEDGDEYGSDDQEDHESGRGSDAEDGNQSDDANDEEEEEEAASQEASDNGDDDDQYDQDGEDGQGSQDGSDGDQEDDDEQHDWDGVEWERVEDHWPIEDARHAPKVLRDIDRWFNNLKTLPGSGEHTELLWPEWEVLRELYRKHNWSSSEFDGDAFLVSVARQWAKDEAKSKTEDDVWAKRREQDALTKKKAEIDTLSSEKPADVNAEWKNKREIFSLQLACKWQEKHIANLAAVIEPNWDYEAEAPKLLPLWEAECLRNRLGEDGEDGEAVSDDALAAVTGPVEGESKEARETRLKRKQALVNARMYTAAYKLAKADAEREFPGQTFTDATGKDPLDRFWMEQRLEDTVADIAARKEDLEATKAFIDTMPAEADAARADAAKHVEDLEKNLGGLEAERLRCEKIVNDVHEEKRQKLG